MHLDPAGYVRQAWQAPPCLLLPNMDAVLCALLMRLITWDTFNVFASTTASLPLLLTLIHSPLSHSPSQSTHDVASRGRSDRSLTRRTQISINIGTPGDHCLTTTSHPPPASLHACTFFSLLLHHLRHLIKHSTTIKHLRHGSTNTAKSHTGRRLNASALSHSQVRPRPATYPDTFSGHILSRYSERELRV
jgi:hypothetical protein